MTGRSAASTVSTQSIVSTMRITLVYSPAARLVQELELTLPSGSTVAQALAASGLARTFPEISIEPLRLGIWGRKAQADQVLQDTDRVEIYRALKVDPKVARRERFVKQGAKKAGLFAQRRAGAKPGY
jgi:uncharacterized protein